MSFGHRQHDAKSLFKLIVSNNQLDNEPISGNGENVTLSMIGQRKGWLGPWMLKCDEDAILLTGHRMWSSAYIAEGRSAKQNVPVDLHRLPKDQWDDSYNHYKTLTNDIAPASLRYLICQHSFMNNLQFEDNGVNFKSPSILRFENNQVIEGQAIPIMPENLIYSLQLSAFLLNKNMSMALNMAQKKIDEFPNQDREPSL